MGTYCAVALAKYLSRSVDACWYRRGIAFDRQRPRCAISATDAPLTPNMVAAKCRMSWK